MPTTLDAKFVPVVFRMLEKYGRPAVFSQPTAYAYNPATGTGGNTLGTPVTTKVTPPDKYEAYFVDGDLIRATDVRVFARVKNLDNSEVFSVPPSAGATTTIDGTVYTIISVGNITSGEFTLLYEVQLRK